MKIQPHTQKLITLHEMDDIHPNYIHFGNKPPRVSMAGPDVPGLPGGTLTLAYVVVPGTKEETIPLKDPENSKVLHIGWAACSPGGKDQKPDQFSKEHGRALACERIFSRSEITHVIAADRDDINEAAAEAVANMAASDAWRNKPRWLDSEWINMHMAYVSPETISATLRTMELHEEQDANVL